MPTSPHGGLRDLDQLKRRAKELLRAFRRGEASAVETVDAHFAGADPARFRLAQAQLVLARSLGYASWARLREAAGALRPERRPRVPPLEMRGTYVHDVDPVDGEQAWELFQACRDGDESRVQVLIAADPKLVHAQYWYTQPVHFAAFANQPAVVRALMEAGAEPGRTRFAGGWITLEEHGEALGFTEVLQVVRDAARERFAFSPDFGLLREAIVSRDAGRVKALLEERPSLGVASDIEGNSAVHWAVMTRQPDLIRVFGDAGADPDRPRGDGQSPAHLLYNGDYNFRVSRDLAGVPHADVPTTLRSLVEAGAEIDLSVACASGDQERVKSLLASDPRLARSLDSGRRNPLTYAVRGGHRGIVSILLDHGADPSQPEEIAPRGLALWEACSAGDVELVQLLLAHGADPTSAPDSSDSCIGIARARAGERAEGIVEMLEAAGASTPMWNMTDDELREALVTDAAVSREPWFAEEVLTRKALDLATALLDKDPDVVHRLTGGRLRLGNPDVAITESAVLALLLERGFDPNRPGWLGKTALHHYAGRGELGNALLVIEYGADVDALDDEGHGTPLAWAAAAGHVAVVRMLLEQGADPGLPMDVPLARPLTRARKEGHADVVALLEREGPA